MGEYGVPAVVAAVSRLDWFRNAAGLVDPAYWRGRLRPRPVLDWYHYLYECITFFLCLESGDWFQMLSLLFFYG